MVIQMKPKSFLFYSCFLLIFQSAFPQTHFGVSVSLHKTAQTSFLPAAGISYEKNISKNNSIEAGIIFRSCIDAGLKYFFLPENWMNDRYIVTYSAKQSFLSVPLVFTQHTKVVSISAGGTVDFFLNWKEKKKEVATYSITSAPTQVPSGAPPTFIYDSPQLEAIVNGPLPFYDFDNKVLFGLLFRISKKMVVAKNIFIEPLISYNPVLTKYSVNRGYKSVKREFLSGGVLAKFSL